jgi:opacity protein-like surface antigen
MFPLFNTPLQTCIIFKVTCIFLLTFTATSFLASAVYAQDIEENKQTVNLSNTIKNRFEIGIAGGFSINQFTKSQPHTGSNTGYTAGASVNYKLIKGISLQLEANFLQQGGRMILFKDDTRIGLPESLETKNVTNSSYTLNSIEVPALISYTINIKPAWKPSVYVGGSYANTFNVHERYQKTGDLLPGEDIIATVSGSKNSTSSFNTSKANLIAGANLKLPLTSKLLLLIDMRYVNGLTSARGNYSYMDKIGFGSDIRANSFISRVGIVMPLK